MSTGEVFFAGSLVDAAFGAGFLTIVGEMTRVVRRGSVGTEVVGAVFGGGGERAGWSAAFRLPKELDGPTAISGLVDVPNETRGDSDLSFGAVSIMGAIGEGGWSCEIRSISGVGLGLESRDVRVFDMERGVVRVVNLAGVRGASAVAKIVRKISKKG